MYGTSIDCPAATQAYTMPQRMISAAVSAYAVAPGGFFPNHKYWSPIGATGTAFPVQGGLADRDAAFVVSTTDNWVVLSLRGTLPTYHSIEGFIAFISDWLQDDETELVPFWAGGQFIGSVHKGFLAASLEIWGLVQQKLMSIDWSNMQGLLVTGHSKGAGMAPIMATLARQLLPNGPNGGPRQILVHAFAAPLSGDPAFANWYAASGLGAKTFRYQRSYDIVPFMPPPDSWNIFKEMKPDWWKPESVLLYGLLEALGEQVTTGYAEVGTMTLYRTPNPPWLPPLAGQQAILSARASILAAIYVGEVDIIMDAHSSAYSYWPAIMEEANPPPTLALVEEEIHAELLAAAD